ncbi:MarR family winged helix-turn-helix transcriptional regulator [Rhizobium sp. Rhizsp42]|uniref:MarR family winged helix-turn-helix transcriptional regulator n=1 Tax=Rhizobium sp. Rhizsp42 TaxID=3243034 RepID=UPI0039AFE560
MCVIAHIALMESTFGPDNCYCFASRRSARWLTRMYDAALSPCNLTISQFSLLTVLEHYGRLKVAELTEVMVMERTSLVRALKPMLDSGLIQSSAQIGERAKVLSLTERGIAKLAEASPYWESAQLTFESQFGIEPAARSRRDNIEISHARHS